jgi:hypothetical protein
MSERDLPPQHSPLPWRLLDGAILSENVNDYGNFIIVESPRRYADETTEQDRRNMELIVRSVNHAEALAEALRGLMRAYCPNAEITAEAAGESALQSDVQTARAALAKWEQNQ